MKLKTPNLRHGLWLIIFLFSLLGSGQIALAQWGLVDTVWVGKMGVGPDMYISPNDSLFISQKGIYNTIDGKLKYFINLEMDSQFMNDSTVLIFNYRSNNQAYDTVKVYNFIQGKYLNKFNCTRIQIPSQSNITKNCNFYSKYDNCLYGFGNEDDSGINNKTRKLNLETGEITEVPFLNGLAGGSFSPDGEIFAGWNWNGYWLNGKYVYDQYLKVISLITYVELIPTQKLLTAREYKDIFPEFTFSKDNHYLNIYSSGINHIWDLDSKKKLLSIGYISSGQLRVSYDKLIFSKSNYKLVAFKRYRNLITYPKLDSISLVTIDLNNLKENEFKFPIGVWGGGIPQALVFDDYHILCDQAWTYENNFEKQIMIGNSCLLKLNIDINSIQEPEQNIQGILYPNPASDYINISVVNPRVNPWVEEQAIRIYDIYGNEMHPPRQTSSDTPQEGNKYRIDVSTLPAGVYFVRIGNENPMKFVKM